MWQERQRDYKREVCIKKCEENLDMAIQKHGSLTETLDMQNAFIYPAIWVPLPTVCLKAVSRI